MIRRLLRALGLDKGLAFVSLGNLIYTAAGAVLWFYLASIMSPDEYGRLNYDIAIVTILTSLGIMGFDTTLTTFVAKGVSKMFPQAAFLVLLSGGVISFFIYVLLQSWSLVILLLGMLLFTLVTANLLGKHSFKQFMLIISTQRILTLILVPVLFGFAGVNGAILGFAISHLVLCKSIFRIIREIDFSISSLRPIRKYFFHSYLLGISKTLPYFSDKIIILPLFGLTTLGFYQFGVQMLTVTAVIPVIFYNYLLPRVARAGTQDLSRTIWLGLLTALSLSTILYLFVPGIVESFFPTFEDAIPSVQVILFAGIPLTAIAILTSVLMGQERSVHVAISALLFICSQYILIIVLGESFGLVGLSASMVAASGIQCTYLLLVQRVSKQADGVTTGEKPKDIAS